MTVQVLRAETEERALIHTTASNVFVLRTGRYMLLISINSEGDADRSPYREPLAK